VWTGCREESALRAEGAGAAGAAGDDAKTCRASSPLVESAAAPAAAIFISARRVTRTVRFAWSAFIVFSLLLAGEPMGWSACVVFRERTIPPRAGRMQRDRGRGTLGPLIDQPRVGAPTR
jgi:hypothetical protein